MKHLWFLKVFVITWFGFFGFEASADTWLDYAGNPQTRQGLTSVLRQPGDVGGFRFNLQKLDRTDKELMSNLGSGASAFEAGYDVVTSGEVVFNFQVIENGTAKTESSVLSLSKKLGSLTLDPVGDDPLVSLDRSLSLRAVRSVNKNGKLTVKIARVDDDSDRLIILESAVLRAHGVNGGNVPLPGLFFSLLAILAGAMGLSRFLKS